jgi:hypothetical protein
MEPVTVTMFGRLVSLPKMRKGGRICYDDAEISSKIAADNIPARPGRYASAFPSRHPVCCL